MPLPPTVSCSSKIQIGFTFLVPAHLGSRRQRAVKRMMMMTYNVQIASVLADEQNFIEQMHNEYLPCSCSCHNSLHRHYYKLCLCTFTVIMPVMPWILIFQHTAIEAVYLLQSKHNHHQSWNCYHYKTHHHALSQHCFYQWKHSPHLCICACYVWLTTIVCGGCNILWLCCDMVYCYIYFTFCLYRSLANSVEVIWWNLNCWLMMHRIGIHKAVSDKNWPWRNTWPTGNGSATSWSWNRMRTASQYAPCWQGWVVKISSFWYSLHGPLMAWVVYSGSLCN